jgi:RimJ/RimL family protein N-acetyltransferase
MQRVVLKGKQIRLEPLELDHTDALVAASAGDAELYRWSPVPQTKEAATKYIETALAWSEAGKGLAFAVVRLSDEQVVGSTRFFEIERFAWPAGHDRHALATPDVCEIGYTWYSRSAVRTAVNTEAKLLLLTHAFETWKVLRVCLHTDIRNERSRAAMERIGCKFEGILRAHRIAADFIARDSARYSIVAAEWQEVKLNLQRHLLPRQ